MTITLDPSSRLLLRALLAVTREALPYIPEKCEFYLLGKSRNLRYELREALNAFEDYLDQTGQAF